MYIYIYTCIHTYIIHRILAQVSDDSLDALDAERDSSRSPARSVVGLVLYRVALLAKLWISKYQIVSSFWNIFIFPYLGNVIIPIDELIFFRGLVYHPPVFWLI